MPTVCWFLFVVPNCSHIPRMIETLISIHFPPSWALRESQFRTYERWIVKIAERIYQAVRVSALVFNRNMLFFPVLVYKYIYFLLLNEWNFPSFSINHCCKDKNVLNAGWIKAPPLLSTIFPSSPLQIPLAYSLPFLAPATSHPCIHLPLSCFQYEYGPGRQTCTCPVCDFSSQSQPPRPLV